MTKLEAARNWVNSFNAVPTGMIGKLWEAYPEDWQEVTPDDDAEIYDVLPMWGMMWSFSNKSDNDWLDDEGLEVMSKCGFRIYESSEFGYFFGIDGAGYDFYDAHWIPLYEARWN